MANHRTDTKGQKVRITLVKSPIGFKNNQAAVVRGLGLRRIRHTVELKDTPATRGMVLAIEPMVNAGKAAVKVLADGWTAVTRDASLSAHFEHTVAVTANGPWVLTAREVPVGARR